MDLDRDLDRDLERDLDRDLERDLDRDLERDLDLREDFFALFPLPRRCPRFLLRPPPIIAF